MLITHCILCSNLVFWKKYCMMKEGWTIFWKANCSSPERNTACLEECSIFCTDTPSKKGSTLLNLFFTFVYFLYFFGRLSLAMYLYIYNYIYVCVCVWNVCVCYLCSIFYLKWGVLGGWGGRYIHIYLSVCVCVSVCVYVM